MHTRYVVRARTLPPHLQAARPGRPTVWDVTEAHTTRPVYHGVHTCPARAAEHAVRLNRCADAAAERDAQDDDGARAQDRARIAATRAPQEEAKPRRVRRRRRPTALPPRTAPWNGTLPDAADIITRVRAAGGSAAYVCANPSVCVQTGGRSPHAIRVTAPAEVTVLAGDMPPPLEGR
ncbi:hypothetical protein Q8791_28985 [Nocardiopsis sp. CT-R113]|uniref:Uncharacterized protein n=1 Tax=Nocardiopsis codii TaxID=3065942 RepID=A0ABU7KGE0_9ACTN|nr:hypothetical protein [Nocardiopsis sp. CT-R113]MEE2041267.1 hypothetical protein [Nocardiopsis sp. CT-R113]